MTKQFYPMLVSVEWAKQLLKLFFTLPEPVDYDNMKVMAVSGKYATYKLIEVHPADVTNLKPEELYMPSSIEHIVRLERVYDPYNEEITEMGYCPAMNTLVVGLTYQVKG